MASITCREARQRLESGMEPGAASPEQTMLGFHLASCTSCQAYRQALHQALLAQLLEQPRLIAARPAPSPSASQRSYRSIALWLGMACIILVLGLLGKVSYAAWNVRNNMQAYIVATPDQTASPQTTPLPTQIVQNQLVSTPDSSPEERLALPAELPQQPFQAAQASLVPIVPTAAQAGLIPSLGPVTPTVPVAAAGQPITVLILGSDRRPGETNPSRTDTIMLAHIDPARQRVALLSLPRDMIVAIPGYGYGRINSAYVTGSLNSDAAGGMALARTTISRLIDTPIDYAVMIDFEGFIGLIDAIGGIDVDVPVALYDSEYPTMDYGYMEIYFEPGLQHMDGARALEYARIRHADSDFERIQRQQTIVLQVVEQLSSKNIITALDQAVTASAALRGYVWTDMPEDRMLSLAWSMRMLKPQQIDRFRVDEQAISFNGITGGCSSADDYWAECVDYDTLQEIVKQWQYGKRE